MSEVKNDSKISAEVLALAKKIEESLEFDAKVGVATEKGNTFESCLPEDISVDTVRKVNDHNANFVAAGGLAFGTLAIAAMKKHSDLEKATCDIKMIGRDKVSYGIERSHSYQNHLTGKGAETVKHGVLTSTYEVKGGKNSGQLKEVRLQLNEMAMAALKK